MNTIYKGILGSNKLYFSFHFSDTVSYFDDWLTICRDPATPIKISFNEMNEWENRWGLTANAYSEFNLSAIYACDYLLKQGQCVFHSAAFLWNGYAYLLTAASGVGKSTQLTNWCKLFPEQVSILNGDKPILSIETESILVYPSPWKGKEKFGDNSTIAPLGGIIILEQGKENKIHRADKVFSISSLMSRILCHFDTIHSIEAAAKIVDHIIRTTPVFHLINTGDLNSTVITYETLCKEVDQFV